MSFAALFDLLNRVLPPMGYITVRLTDLIWIAALCATAWFEWWVWKRYR